MQNASENIDRELLHDIWKELGLPESALSAIVIEESLPVYREAIQLPSSFRVNDLATASIGAFHLAAAQYHSLATSSKIHHVTVSRLAAALEFKSETHFAIDGKPLDFPRGFGGLHATKDGYVRIHDGFEIHREGTRQILGLHNSAGREEVAAACMKHHAVELEDAAFQTKAVIGALRSQQEWNEIAPGRSVPRFPIRVEPLDAWPAGQFSKSELPHAQHKERSRCLAGVRVLELSRVIAAPVAGRALASHGADVLWVTSSSLEDQPYLDRDLARGKRSVRLDLDTVEGIRVLKNLIHQADVFIQAYRPGSLAKRGLSPEELLKVNPRLVYASLSAYPQTDDNPWQPNRGFDSIIQACSGINVAEAESFNRLCSPQKHLPAKTLPCQALDHASGFLLATGILAALCRVLHGGSGQLVQVSLAGTARLLSSLPRFDTKDCFQGKPNTKRINEVLEVYGSDAEGLFEERDSYFGRMKFVKPAGYVRGMQVGWERMPGPLGSDNLEWLNFSGGTKWSNSRTFETTE